MGHRHASGSLPQSSLHPPGLDRCGGLGGTPGDPALLLRPDSSSPTSGSPSSPQGTSVQEAAPLLPKLGGLTP